MKPTIENTARIEIRIILYLFLIYRDVKLPHNISRTGAYSFRLALVRCYGVLILLGISMPVSTCVKMNHMFSKIIIFIDKIIPKTSN